MLPVRLYAEREVIMVIDVYSSQPGVNTEVRNPKIQCLRSDNDGGAQGARRLD